MACLSSCRRATAPVVSEFSERVYSPQYANGFVIDRVPGKECFELKILSPWQGADSVSTSSLVIDKAGKMGEDAVSQQVLDHEAQRLVVMSSSHIAMLDALGATDRIVGVSGLKFISNKHLLARQDEIADVGYDGNYNYEALIGCKPDLVLLYGIDGASQLEPRLVEMGIPFVYIGDYIEESPLGKCEWVVAMGMLTGLQSKAEAILKPIAERYDSLSRCVQASGCSMPTVMLNTPYRDTWFMPSTDSYMAHLIEDAGGEYIYKENNSGTTLPIDIEEAWRLTNSADLWINTGRCNSLEDLADNCQRFVDAPCVRKGNVYNNTRRLTPGGGNDFYESGIMHPDLILRDLIKIFHPGLLPDSTVLTYYKPLGGR